MLQRVLTLITLSTVLFLPSLVVAQDTAPTPDSDQQLATPESIDEAHRKIFAEDPFPSANRCKTCHPDHYREWSVSPHSYAQMSPVFNAMSSKLIQMTNGTLGDFCIRCHTPVGMALDEPITMSNMDRHPAAREGITCVVCHRINQNWGKGSGRQALVAGGLGAPLYGPTGSSILEQALSQPETFGAMKTDADQQAPGRPVHGNVQRFFALTTSASCGACHDVFAPNGFRLEDAFSEFKSSPAARVKGQNCQDCHMATIPGVASPYAVGPAAKVGNVPTPPRKRTNHMFVGPDYPIIHPGIFPHNPEAVRETHSLYANEPEPGLATMREWLLFDHEAGWGTDEFERGVDANTEFPEPWKDPARRFRAREILNDQFALLKEARRDRHRILSTGYRLSDIRASRSGGGVAFSVTVSNGTDGHGVPTGFDAERLVFLRAKVRNGDGRLLFISGDLDPNGDVRDSHSFYVHNGELPLDRQLFTLQSKFITRNIRGGEREQILNVPFSLDPLPFMRPNTRPFTVQGRPLGARKHKQNLEVNGSRVANYFVNGSRLRGGGPYQIEVKLISGMVPVNLVHEISSAGFDYGMSAKEIAENVVDGHLVLHRRTAVVR